MAFFELIFKGLMDLLDGQKIEIIYQSTINIVYNK